MALQGWDLLLSNLHDVSPAGEDAPTVAERRSRLRLRNRKA